MSKTKWTEEQLSAIDTRNCNLLVAAAAGSGKTAVLVERIIRIITNEENPVDIDKLLVVTFTNAAAAEMRERIASAISKALDKNPNSKNLQKQLTLLNRANITTMHSFCLDVIKNNFHKIDLDPSFRIGDQTECTLIKAEAIEELFEDKYDNDDQEFIDLVEAFSNYKSDENLKDLILDLYNFVMSGPWPQKWLQDSVDAFKVENIEQLNNSRWVKVLGESIKVELKGYIRMMERALNIINDTDGLEPYIDNFQSELEEIKYAYLNVDNGLNEMYKSLSRISFGRLKSIKKDSVFDVDAQNLVKKIRDDIKKKISDLISTTFAVTPEEMLINIKGAYPYISKLSDIVLEFSKVFNKKKKDKNILDFNDLEHLCLKILSDSDENGNIIASSVAVNFKDYFDEVLVDEYQDSNNVQEAIIDLVSRKHSDIPNVFMVGDVKQSIYRFRQAKPELFIEKYNSYKIGEGMNRKIQLYKNFRSRKEILDSVNFIFKELMSDVVGELEYSEEESLNLGASYEDIDDGVSITGGSIEVNIIDKSGNIVIANQDEEFEIQEDMDSANLEGRVIAARIKELVSSKEDKIFKVLDKETGEYRPLKYKDIVILLRATKNWAETLLDELNEAGIPVYADTGTGYFESIEIRTIMSLLKIIDNPMQDVPMLSVLKSPIMGFSAEELSDIRLFNKEKYFYENIKEIKEDGESYSDSLRKKCGYVLECIDRWRKKAIYMPIDEFIWYLYMDTAYYGYVGAMPNGMLRQANLKILFQRAKQFEQTSFKGLFNFINFINKVTKSSGDMGSAKILGEHEDVVRIMSIHKSKGLEFPVVFLCGAGKNFNLMDLNKNILYHDDLGLGPDYIDLDKRFSINTIAKDAIKKKIKFETLSEEMRILYVACTRAKEKLIVTGSVRDIEKSIEKWVSAASLDKNIILPSEVLKGKSYLDWLGMALCQHNDGPVLRDYIRVSNEIAKDDDSKWTIRIWNKSELASKVKDDIDEEDENELSILKNEGNFKISEEIKRRLEYEYPLVKSTTLKSNISVSELKRKNQEENFEAEELYKEKEIITPKFLQEVRGISAAEKGTALHFMMRKVDLNRISSLFQIKEQIQELYDNDFISQEELNSINPFKILKFFRSDLGMQMIKAQDNGTLYREISFYTYLDSTEIYDDLSDKYSEEKIRLQGIIDCFFELNNKVILLDYKTDFVLEGNEDELKEKYKKQLEYYSDAIYKMIGKKVDKKYLYSFYLEKEIEI